MFLPLAHDMPEEAFSGWDWRIPFILSFVVLIAGYIIREEVDETAAFAQEESHGAVARPPMIEAIRSSWVDMLRAPAGPDLRTGPRSSWCDSPPGQGRTADGVRADETP